MWNPPTKRQLAAIPKLYATEKKPLPEKIIHMHFFIGGCDWYIAEFSAADGLMYGFAILNNDLECAEWGYISLEELQSINISGIQVDRDLHWRVRPAKEVDKIREWANLYGYNGFDAVKAA